MHATQSLTDQRVPSASPTVIFRWLFDVHKVPLWRYVVPRQDNVEEHLAKMSREGSDLLRSQMAMARCAEEGRWQTACSSYSCCGDILKREEAHLGTLSYSLLRLWAEFPLAQIYQLRGSTEGSAQMLEKAVETWREIVVGIMPYFEVLPELHPELSSYLYTAEYECGCAQGDSEMKFDAMQKYAKMIGSEREADAEPELCLLLSYDYFWWGRFEDSLMWIEKANRLRQHSPPQAAYLRWEVCVLMKLRRFEEGTRALDRLSIAPVPDVEARTRAEEVRRWRQDCYKQMHKSSTSDGDQLEDPNENEELRELQNALALSLGVSGSNQEQASQHGNLEAATPVKQILDEMLAPDSSSVRSWLSVEHFQTLEFHVLKLPEGPRIAFLLDLHRLLEAFNEKRFDQAIFELNCWRGMLRTLKNCIENEVYYSILACVDHTLADLYQFCEDHRYCQFEKALEIRRELLICIQNVEPSDKYMELHYTSLAILAEYQGCSSGDALSEQIVQKYGSLTGMDKDQAECDMCFWLFFRDRCLWRKLRQLKNEVMPRWEHSGINHSLSYRHLIRCEAELLLDTAGFLSSGEDRGDYLETVKLLLEHAEGILKDLIQRFEGQTSYEAWVHAMLKECYLKLLEWSADAGHPQRTGEYQDLANRENDLHESLVSKLDLNKSPKPSSIAVINKSQLIQAEEHIMDKYYWVRFAATDYLAFQKVYDIGRYAQDEGDWECAIFNLESCRDLLKRLEVCDQREVASSLAWVDLPLVQLYQMQTKNLRKALDLRQEMRNCFSSFKVMNPIVGLAVHANFHAAIYHFFHLNYPSYMDTIMDEIMKLVPGNLREFWQFFVISSEQQGWEYYLVSTILYWHFVQGSYETALDIIGILKQVVNKHFPEDMERKDQNMVFEVECLMELKMFQDAALVLRRAPKGEKKFEVLQMMCQNGVSGIHLALFEGSRNAALTNLRITGVYCHHMKWYKRAAYFHFQCIRIIAAAENDSPKEGITRRASEFITEHRGQPGWYDIFHLGKAYRKIFKTKMRSYVKPRESLWTQPYSSNARLVEEPSIQDEMFAAALCSFEILINIVVNPDLIARANHEILKLYAAMDESYFGYLLIKFGLKDAHDVYFTHRIADMNNVKLMEDQYHTKKAQYSSTATDRSILEDVEASMIKYCRRASLQFANSLYAMKGRYTESWINVLEGHKDVYVKLQRHYLNKMFLEALTTPDYDPEAQPKIMDEYRWKAFLYAERQRSRVLLYQLGPQKLTSVVARQLWEFDTNDLHAMDIIQAYVSTLEKDSVFVEYTHLQKDVWIIYVIQAAKISHYLLTLKSEMARFKKVIRNILLLFKGKPMAGYNIVKMNEDLEYLHDTLIKPIERHLCQMKLQHKLILAPSELLTKVPFAALRDRTGLDKEKYLTQRHTISLVPSLRAFNRCYERLEDLQKLDPQEGPGAIIALGDPTYGKDGNKEPLPPLFGTKTEVDDIAGTFPKIPVVKLLGADATAEKLLQWVENPSHKSFRQVIVHVGAHGSVDEQDERNSCLFLATSAGAESSAAGSFTAGRRMDDALNMGDEEDDEDGSRNEELMKALSDMVNKRIGEFPGVEVGREEEMGKGNDEGKEKEGSSEEEKGKDKEEYFDPPPEVSITELIEWAEKSSGVMVYWQRFAEHPKLRSKQTGPPKRLGPHVCSILTLKDISDSRIPWRAELVVLSACYTSKGNATAEGLVNLARAFIIAGVPCVVASQWGVLDHHTPILMRKFYAELRRGEDVASSLRSAMSSMIDAGHEVRAWAPFVIWGSSSLVLPEYLRCKR